MQTFIALSGNLSRASLDHPNGEDQIPVIVMAFDVLEDDGPVEIIVDAENLRMWLESALVALDQDFTAEEETAEILADPAAMAAIAEADAEADPA